MNFVFLITFLLILLPISLFALYYIYMDLESVRQANSNARLRAAVNTYAPYTSAVYAPQRILVWTPQCGPGICVASYVRVVTGGQYSTEEECVSNTCANELTYADCTNKICAF